MTSDPSRRALPRGPLTIEAKYLPEGGTLASLGRGSETLVGVGELLSDALYDLARQVRLAERGWLSTTALDAMDERAASALRRAGVRTDLELAQRRCADLLELPDLGRGVALEIVRAVTAARLRLACGCGWDGEGFDACDVGRRRRLRVAR